MNDLKKRFEKWCSPEPNTGCILWIGSNFQDGYGSVTINKKSRGAHRVSWELYVGTIPINKIVCHKCDTPACVNPDHLFLGSHSDNAIDAMRKGRRIFPQKTHCRKGHKFIASNIFMWAGRRRCKLCYTNNRRKKTKWKGNLYKNSLLTGAFVASE